MSMPTLSTTELIAIGAVALVVIIAIAALVLRRKSRSEKLRRQFGEAEYARAIALGGNRREAETGLEGRAQRVEEFQLRALGAGDRARFEESWRGIQGRFVDGPAGAVSEADQLLGDVMSARGYPVSDFEQRAADISVDHPIVLQNYRTAHAIAVRQTQGRATTEELRQAMVHYRTLFEELVSAPAGMSTKASA